MRILSIDVGVKNLGVCEMEVDDGTRELSLGFWGVVGGGEGADADASIQTAISGAVAAMTELNDRTGGAGWDCVVIENQPCIKNPRMKAVQIAIHTFMVIHHGPDASVCLAGAVGKNKVADRILLRTGGGGGGGGAEATAGQRYRRAKKRSVEAGRAFLEARGGFERELEALAASSKKDDMCDALLQGVYYLTAKAKLLSEE
eukprot:jgi/Tetstr1/464110/TSEL_008915.t1